jgi:cellulose synthase/poly-beta-1,6-N-acetylglucosamine synthase-like glycosyltransferase
MENALYIFLGLYLAEHLILFIGVLINSRKMKSVTIDLPKVSVIVAAKDEELNIGGCIESMLKLDYPNDKLEIILVNDRSTDRTGEIMQTHASRYPFLKYVEIKDIEGKLKGKTNALANAIAKAVGEIILTTDADIKVKPGWVRGMIGYYEQDSGVVSSFSAIIPKGLFSGLQSIDWLYLLGIAAGGDGIGQPISCVGNNMSYRRKAYDEVGGYENIKFSVTEDFMLLQTINKRTKWKTKFPVDNSIMNETYPCGDIKELYRQKKRWAKGGLDSHSAGMIVGAMAWFAGAAIFAGWAIGLKAYIIFFIAKFVMDAVYIFPIVKEFKMWKAYLFLPIFELYFAVYVFFMPFILLIDRKVVWKSQKI